MAKEKARYYVVNVKLKPEHREVLDYLKDTLHLSYAQGIKAVLEMLRDARFFTCPKCQQTYFQSPDQAFCSRCLIRLLPAEIEVPLDQTKTK